MRVVYEYTADKTNTEGKRNKRLYDSTSGKHQEFALGETVYIMLDRHSFAKVKKRSELTAGRRHLLPKCSLIRLMRCNMLKVTAQHIRTQINRASQQTKSFKGVRSQGQKDIPAEA